MTRLMTGVLCLFVASWALADEEGERKAEPKEVPADEVAADESAGRAEGTPRAKLRQVDLNRQVDPDRQVHQEPVCVREAPTGSRISVRRCHVPVDPNSAAAALERDINRQEFELMRQRQMAQEQARRSAEAAMRRPNR